LVNGFKIVSDLPAVQQVSLSHSATISLPLSQYAFDACSCNTKSTQLTNFRNKQQHRVRLSFALQEDKVIMLKTP